MILETMEQKLEKFQSRTFAPLIVITTLGLLLRIMFTSWHMPSEAPDTFIYLVLGLSYSHGDFSNITVNFLWPFFLSIFYSFMKFDNYFDYMTVMRIISIIVSVSTIPILYLVTREFVEKKYALIASAFFAIESNLIENSTLALSEPLFILLGLLSFYFLIQKNEKYLPLSFVFAGLAFETRLNGIVLLFLILFGCTIKIRPRKNLIKTILIGVPIFLVVISPYLFAEFSSGNIPLLGVVSGVSSKTSSGIVNPHLFDPSKILLGPQQGLFENIFDVKSGPLENPSPIDIYKIAILKEFLHLFRISIPFLAIFVPYGIIIALQQIDFKIKILFTVIIISLIVAIPQYAISAVYRNLFFIIPFFCILSTIGIKKLISNIESKNIFLVLLICALLLVSYGFLRERSDIDMELVVENEKFGKFVVSNFKGVIFGDAFNYILHYVPDITKTPIIYNINDNLTLLDPPRRSFMTYDSLIQYSKEQNVTYIIVDNQYDNRYPIFQDIYYNESKYTELEKVFDSDKEGYKKYRVKIFKTTHDDKISEITTP